MEGVRFFTSRFHIYMTTIFNVVRYNHGSVRTLPKINKPFVTLGLAFPTTVHAWSFTKKKEENKAHGLNLVNNNDIEVIKAIQAADNMYATGELNKNDEVYEQLKKCQDKNEPEILWRLARSTYEKAKKDVQNKKALVKEAYDLVKASLELNDNNFGAHKWMAILLNEKSKMDGLKEQITQSFVVKHHMERACELNPNDATSAYLLGQWCYSVSEVGWVQQKLASAIFATPPTSTYQEALTHFMKAESIQPLFYSMNLLMLARTYWKLGDNDSANACLEKLATYPVKNEEDYLARKEGAQLRSKISPNNNSS